MKYLYDFKAIRKHISFTFLTQMISCPRSAMLGRILRVPVPYKESKARDTGTLVHGVLEQAMKEAIDQKKILDKEGYIKAFETEMEKNKEKVYHLPMSVSDLAEHLQEYHEEYFGARLHEDVQVEFELPNETLWGLEIKGRVDLQVGQDVIDYKTKSRSTEKKALTSTHMAKLQGAFYNKALKQTGKRIESFQAHNLIITTKTVKVVPYKFNVSELEACEPELREMVENAIRCMKTGEFIRNYNNMYCPCEYVDYCMDDNSTVEFIKSINLPENIY